MFKLRELKKEDISQINMWRNDKDLISCLGAPYRYINTDVDNQWYDNYMKSRNNTVRCSIVNTEEEDIVLGLVSLTGISSINQSAEFHIMIGDSENRGKGIGSYATIEMLKHAFYNLNLNRIELSVLESNTRAVNLYEKVGFKKEGLQIRSTYKNGEFVNTIIMALLKDDFVQNYIN
mgnify:CR=1 FL=1